MRWHVQRVRDPRRNRTVTLRGRQSAFGQDRKSTRLNSSHSQISYAVFCLKKKKNTNKQVTSTVHSTLWASLLSPYDIFVPVHSGSSLGYAAIRARDSSSVVRVGLHCT